MQRQRVIESGAASRDVLVGSSLKEGICSVGRFAMKRLMPVFFCCAMVLGFLAGYAVSPAGSLSGQAPAPNAAVPAQTPPLAGALPPGDYSRINIAPDQGEPTLFSGAALRKAHPELQARAKNGQVVANPRDLMPPLVTRTHWFTLLHRPALPTASASPNAEQHEGASDIYFIVAGTGTVTVGGSIDAKRTARPGEYQGAIKGGKPFKVAAGDILNIPPNTPHATVPDTGGLTYVLMKVNVGMYPWSLINGTP
jgi:mannose-6-phosphate isomerase-like protein (cupin superfamily)